MWVFLWIALSFIVGFFGSGKRVGYWGAFFLSLLLSPLIGLIIAILSPDEEKTVPVVQIDKKGWKHYYELGQRYEFKEKYAEALDAYQDSLFELKRIDRKLSKKEQQYKDSKHSELEVLIDDLKKRLEN
jgi:hypothetical protein